MKKISLGLTVLLLTLAACTSSEYWKLRIDIPRLKAADLDPFKEIFLTHFLIKADTKDFNTDRELVDYFEYVLKEKTGKAVSARDITVTGEETFGDENFWKGLSGDFQEAVWFTGSVLYSEEIRKALVGQEKRKYEDPFHSEIKLAERKFYKLQLDCYLIEAKTGKILFHRTFDETKNYKNPNQTSYFAFFDLIQTVKDKLFRSILGEEKIQERYLISH